MKKKIWLINQYAVPPKYETRIQTLKRAQYLSEFGYDVTVIGGSYIHNTNINLVKDSRKFILAEYNGIKFIHIRTNNYSKNGFKRVLNLIKFPLRLYFLADKFDKPDVIVQTATVPFGNILYYLSKRYKAQYIVDILDLWPETFYALGMISKKNPLLKLAYLAEYWLYKRADDIVFSMEGGKKYIVDKKWDLNSGGRIDLNKVHYINNGVDLNDFDLNNKLFRIQDEDLDNDKIFKVIYLGSIRLANDVKKLIDAASILKEYRNIKILVYGDGEEREALKKHCTSNDINNVVFKEKWVELKYVPSILTRSSLNILNYNQSSIWDYGGSQSKSFQYMASGRPIISNLEMAFCPIKKFNLGVARRFESAKEYADTIMSFVNMKKEEYNKLCSNSRKAALNYDYKMLAKNFEKVLN